MSNQNNIQKNLEDYCCAIVNPDPEWPHGVHRAVECIRDHLFDPKLSVRWMKKQCHLNGNNFSGKFKYYVGMTPKQYWLDHRIKLAKKLIREDISITMIALGLGFNSLSAFTMLFKKYEGCSPTDYREEKC
ncbi:helix-turn-helix transcriptional regulator [Fodinibius salsisoli]|uniref:Helix-turn-helix transcriptional regulator n=1 Tax=Fodinibius salsisoli TaxID=2820877 RepID=A0ABT3PJP7_9BACT|nr:AraC family transcriptional regulator [Fodinibius salsisoli]MCW9706173.1 helix-turn-helix transcriptional regulator [Fodinibius salsisoli]